MEEMMVLENTISDWNTDADIETELEENEY